MAGNTDERKLQLEDSLVAMQMLQQSAGWALLSKYLTARITDCKAKLADRSRGIEQLGILAIDVSTTEEVLAAPQRLVEQLAREIRTLNQASTTVKK